MNSLAWILATTTAAAGVDYGWQPSPGGQELEYLIQIEPAVMNALQAGEEITSEIPPELAGVRRFRIRVGNGPVPRIPLNPQQFGRTGPPAGKAATIGGQRATIGAQTRQTGPLDGLPPPPQNSALSGRPTSAPGSNAKAGALPSHVRTTPNPFGTRPAPGEPAATPASQPGQLLDEASRWDPRARHATISEAQNALGAARNPAELARANQLSLRDGQPTPAKAGLDERTGSYQAPSFSKSSDRFQDPSLPQRAAEAVVNDPRNAPYGNTSPPPRPRSNGASAPSNALPPQPDMSSRFRGPNNGGYPPSSLAVADPTARNAPRAALPGFGSGNQVPSAAVPGDSRSVEGAGFGMPRPLKKASFDQPADGTVQTGAFQMEKPTLPEELANPPYKPWGWFIAILFGFLISMSANFYLGWIAWDLHRRYRAAVLQMTDAAALGV